MKGSKEQYVCRECGYDSPRWLGKCPNCQAWNSFGVLRTEASSPRHDVQAAESVSIAQAVAQPAERQPTGEAEFDRVLGGGLVPGAVFLLAGEPGIGKSTLLLTLAGSQARRGRVVYVTGEETASQVAQRAKRLGVDSPAIEIVATQSLDAAAATVRTAKPALIIIDSVQTLGLTSLPNPLGSVVQTREVTLELGRLARSLMTPIVFVGHVTKEGDLAGPKVLEHLVDTVLLLEGDRQHDLRLLRTVKNRFGATDEVGVFAMTERGLEPISNPSARFLEGRSAAVPGSAVVATLEGTRALLIEIQALAQTSQFGYPKRTASGFDTNRLQLLLAVLEQRSGVPASHYDVYLNIVGGVRLREPAVDLAVCLAVASAIRNQPVPPSLAVWGEVGLSGEIRRVGSETKRAAEATRQGFTVPSEPKELASFMTTVFGNTGRRRPTGGGSR